VFIGYHIHPGGVWSGDYLVAELAPLRKNFDVVKSKIKIHRIKEVVTNHTGKFTFPVAELRQKGGLGEAHFGPPCDPEMPDLVVDESDDEALPQAAGSSTDIPDVPIQADPPLEAVPSHDGPLSGNTGLAPGTDTRGMGLETFGGRGGVRVRKGSTRPPDISPELWQSISKKKKNRRLKSIKKNSPPPPDPTLLRPPSRCLLRPMGRPVKPHNSHGHGSLLFQNKKNTATKTGTHQLASRADCPKRKWMCVQGLVRLWTPNGKNCATSSDRTPPKALEPGMRVTFVRRLPFANVRKSLAKRFTLEELLNFATKREVN
jgi:hypothetical protein